MTVKRRITVLLVAGLVVAAVIGVYYMPLWQQTSAAVSKGSRDRFRPRAHYRRAHGRRSGLISTASALRRRSTP